MANRPSDEWYDDCQDVPAGWDMAPVHSQNGHDKVNCPTCHPDRTYRPHTCEWCGKWMAWDDQSCACMCRANRGYNG